MKALYFLVPTIVVAFPLVGCGDEGERDDENGHGGEDGHGGAHSHGEGGAHSTEDIDHCCVLGAMCHVVGDDVDPEVEACHELGHANVGETCEAEFQRCSDLCEGLTEPVEHACD